MLTVERDERCPGVTRGGICLYVSGWEMGWQETRPVEGPLVCSYICDR